MHYYTTSRLSENMEVTPEGYLLCKSVPIARVGALEYLPEEVPDEVSEGASGPTVLVYRTPEDLFSEATIASYEGKDVTIDHPDDFVTPQNWRELTCGHAQDARQGEGEESDLLLVDLLIKDQAAIDLIVPQKVGNGGGPQEPLREVSCGYDADYEVVAPGIGKQTNIIGNHIALVPHGRCGSRCAIKDKEPFMAKIPAKKTSWWDRIMGNPKVKRAMDEAAEEEKAKDEGQKPAENNSEQQTATDAADLGEKLDEVILMIRSMLEAMKPADDDTPAGDEGASGEPEQTGDGGSSGDGAPNKAGDSGGGEPDESGKSKTGDAKVCTANAMTISRAGKLAPSMRFMVGDSDSAVKRSSLRFAMQDSAIAEIVNSCLNGVPLDKATGPMLDSAFVAAAEFARAHNNAQTGKALAGAKAKDSKAKGPTTPADINKINREFYDSHSKKEL